MPLLNTNAAEIGGRLEIHSLEVTPSPSSQSLVLLVEQIRAIVERRPPPAELGRNPVLLSMSGQQIDFKMIEGRVHHQGLTMRIGDVDVRTRGWVAMDQTISLVAEVPILDKWVNNDPLLAGLKGQVSGGSDRGDAAAMELPAGIAATGGADRAKGGGFDYRAAVEQAVGSAVSAQIGVSGEWLWAVICHSLTLACRRTGAGRSRGRPGVGRSSCRTRRRWARSRQGHRRSG